ncbi:protein ADP-ribosyltransferase PARP3-like isoform X2 [Salvia hispanica]|uniref:protein ADP-ribosyltransferase PARP3-like isoform X2 n=1 Tax=Salvia hispanica TaxID=49212 RepID=UPI002009A32C|nr:protein ADP-ribosyltransferase PARP3-like isoform X2 [Salvia hispanica]
MKVHETRSDARCSGDQERVATRKHKAEAKASEGGSDHWAKRAKTVAEERAEDVKKAKAKGKEQAEDVEKENGNEKSTEEIIAEFEKFCKAMSEHLSLQQMREILEANGGVNDVVVPGWGDLPDRVSRS